MKTIEKFLSLACAAAAILMTAPAIPAGSCTTAIVGAKASATGRPLLWKQRDSGNQKNVVAHVTGGKYAYTSIFKSSDTKHESAFGGANEAGFAIINNQSYNISAEKYKARNGSVMRQALETCATVDEFEKMLRDMPEPCPTTANFGVIDAEGNAAYIEAGGSTIVRYDVPEDGYLVRSNYSLAGVAELGKGYARYETADFLMRTHEGKFTVDDLIDGLGRSFRNQTIGCDLLRDLDLPYALDEDFIPRPTTASSICIEGIGKGDDASSAVIWAAPGYTPTCYAIPVWVAAGNEIPACISAGPDGESALNILSLELRDRAHELPHDGKKYINFKTIREMMALTREAEKKEREIGTELDRKFRRKGIRMDAVRKYNEEAEKRFELYRLKSL